MLSLIRPGSPPSKRPGSPRSNPTSPLKKGEEMRLQKGYCLVGEGRYKNPESR